MTSTSETIKRKVYQFDDNSFTNYNVHDTKKVKLRTSYDSDIVYLYENHSPVNSCNSSIHINNTNFERNYVSFEQPIISSTQPLFNMNKKKCTLFYNIKQFFIKLFKK